jgi:esterase/lipase superfamily enzyme
LDKIRALEIIIVTGREDTLLQSNMELSQELHKQGICHQFHIWDEEAHRARYWRQMAYHYL